MAPGVSDTDGPGLADIDVVVLAGGLGTRLRGVLPDRPKILAPIGDEPYIAFLLDWLAHEGASRIIFSLGYRANQVQSYLATNPPHGLCVDSVIETEPAGTAGALRFVAPKLSSDPVMVMNGDSFIDANLSEFLRAHREGECGVTILCVELPDVSRFGRIETDDRNRVTRFAEKDPDRVGAGLINAGVYLFDRTVLDDIVRGDAKSLERDVFGSLGDIGAHVVAGTFLDIGTPESLAAAEAILRPYRRRPVQ